MKASTYYRVTGLSAGVAVLATLLADNSNISSTLLGFVGVSSAIVALTAYFLNSKSADTNPQVADQKDTEFELLPTLEYRGDTASDGRGMLKNRFLPLIKLIGEPDLFPKYFLPSQNIGERIVSMSYHPALNASVWQLSVLNKEIAQLFLDRNETTKMLDSEFRHVLMTHSVEYKTATFTLLKQAELLEQEIEKLAQRRLERAIERAGDTLAREREDEGLSSESSREIAKPVLH